MQDRKTYAEGVTNVTAEAKASIGMPVVDGEYTVASEATAASFAGKIPESGSMLVTLEVNGTVIAYREMYTFDSDEGYIKVGDYYIANDSGSVIVETMEGGDVVRLKVEPVVIEVNDVFRAAVGEVAPKSEGGGSGGGVLIVNVTDDENDENATKLDKTWTEINEAPVAFVAANLNDNIRKVLPICTIGASTNFITGDTTYFVDVVMYGETMENTFIARFTSNTEDGVLTYTEE